MIINIKSKKYDTSQKPLIMGILNLSTDSPIAESVTSVDQAVNRAKQLIFEGATIIDVGADSTSSKASGIDIKDEAELIKLVVNQLSDLGIVVSIDTWKPAIAEVALKAGASIVNDVTGFRDPVMVQIAKEYSAIALAMHMRGDPKQHYEVDQSYLSIQNEVFDYLKQQNAMLNEHGINDVWIDPGFGFGKSAKDNVALFHSIAKYKKLKLPIVISASRKGFLAELIGMGNTQKGDELLEATMLFNILSFLLGADILRVHDVKNMHTTIETLHGLGHYKDDPGIQSDYYGALKQLF
ncbi:MAG: dihydropteroate synthase [Chloroflexi bacterium]|nr:dihydropteroate synthase [Chloroflexota bacterium]|tara:strand:+ start:2166 stop:3053 length:888 start_codon:yes stop_codon:yes gene_type:complete